MVCKGVGTRGGGVEGKGPCACPGGRVRFDGINMFMGGQANRTGTSTRPPHPPHTAPCPYARAMDYAGIQSVHGWASQQDGDKHEAPASAPHRPLSLRACRLCALKAHPSIVPTRMPIVRIEGASIHCPYAHADCAH